MNKKVVLILVVMLSALPAFECMAVKSRATSRCDAAVDLAATPGRALTQTSLADVCGFLWHTSLSDLPIVERFFGKGGVWTYEWQGQTAQVAVTAVLVALAAYQIATNKTVKEKTSGAMKYMKDCCKKNPRKVLQAHTRKWKKELNEEKETA